MSTPAQSTTGLPVGDWQIDLGPSELVFSAKTFWGLLTVQGHFGDFAGTLHVDEQGASGTLTVQAASLDTHNAKRDKHLRSADFFDVEAHPTFTFTLEGAEATHGHVHLNGTLALPGAKLPLTLHADVDLADGFHLRGGTTISRAEAHMDWNQLGMMRDEIVLIADLVLTPA